METNRHKYTIIFATESAQSVRSLAVAFGALLTKSYGGCTISQAVGFWAEDGADDKPNYGKQMTEPARKVEVVTMQEQSLEIKVLFSKAVKNAKELTDYDFKGQWIHFEHIEIECEHFQI